MRKKITLRSLAIAGICLTIMAFIPSIAENAIFNLKSVDNLNHIDQSQNELHEAVIRDSDSANDFGKLNQSTSQMMPLYGIGLVKSISDIQPSATTGNYEITIKYTVRNVGTDAIFNINLVDNLATQWGSAFVGVINPPIVLDPANNIGAINTPLPNGLYDGDVSDNLLSGIGGRLGPGGGGKYIEVFTTVEIDLSEVPSTGLFNQASASATDLLIGTQTVMDLSDDNTNSPDPDDAMGDNPNGAGDDGAGGLDDPTPILISDIRTTKEIVSYPQPVPNNNPGNYEVTYLFKVYNNGTTTLSSINLYDNFQSQFGSAFLGVSGDPIISQSVTDPGSTDPSINPSFNGFALNDDLVVGGILSSKDSFFVTVTIDLDMDLLPDPAINQSNVTAIDPNNDPVSDDSDDRTDLNNDNIVDNPDGMNPEDDPTPVTAVPEISVAKMINMVIEGSSSDEQLVTYRHIVKNVGNVTLEDLQLVDDIETSLLGGYAGTVDITVFSAVGMTAATTDPTASASTTAMDGVNSAVTGGLVEPGQEFIVDITVLVDLTLVTGTQPFYNQSIASGQPTDGMGAPIVDPRTGLDFIPVDDTSDSGTDADGDNPGAPNFSIGTPYDDPTPLSLPGRIGVVKSIASVSPAMTFGNYNVTINYTIENTGSNNLTELDLVDMINAQWGAAFVGVSTPPSILTAGTDALTTDPTVNLAFDGGANSNFLSNDGALSPDEFITVQVVVEVDASEAPASGLNNQATTSGMDPLGNDIMDMSDDNTSSLDPDDPNGDNPNGAGDDGNMDTNNASPLNIPEIGLAKKVTAMIPAASGTPGNFDVTYQLVLQNTGTTPLENIVLTDDVTTQLAPAFVGIIEDVSVSSNTATTAPVLGTLPMIYTGLPSLLLPGELITLEYTLEIDADMMPVAGLNNQANTEATPTDGAGNPLGDPNNPGADLANVTDLSDSGADPTTTNPGEPVDPSDPTPDGANNATPLPPLPSINVAKSITLVTDPAASGIVGNVDVLYTFEIKNTGNTRLDNISLVDDIVTQYGSAFAQVALPVSTTVGGPNVTFIGSSPSTEMLDGSASLLSGETMTVTMTLEVDPDAIGAVYNMNNELENQGTVSGTPVDGMGNPLLDGMGMDLPPVTDNSDTGTDPETDNDDMPGDPLGGTPTFDDPTILKVPSIVVAKSVQNVAPSATGPQGNFDVTLRYVVHNDGNVNLSSLSLMDDIAGQYLAAYVGVVTPPMITSNTAAPGPTTNAAYAGTGDLLIPAATDLMELNEEFTIDIVIEVDPSQAMDTLFNSAIASGQPLSNLGTPVGPPETDNSDSGTNPETDNPSAPGHKGTAADSTPLVLPSISVAKAITLVTDPAASGIVGNVDVLYTFEIKNTGNTRLDNVSLIDDIKTEYDNAFVSVMTPVAATVGGGNVAFTGSNPSTELLDQTASLLAGESMTVTVVMELDPDATGAIYNVNGELENQATITATPVDASGNSLNDNNGSPFAPVTDESDNGVDPEDDNDFDAMVQSGFDDPTVLSVSSVVVAKEIKNISTSASGIEGNFDVTIRYNVQNDGNEDLSLLSLTDDIIGQYGTAFIGVVTNAAFVNNTAAMGPSLNGVYAGTGDLLVPALTDLMRPNQGYVLDIVLEIDASEATDTLFNSAITIGQPVDPAGAPNSFPVIDESDSGPNPETDNPLVDDDKGTAQDSTSLVLPNISVSKRQVGFVETVAGPYGNVDLTLELIVQNSGNTPLTNIQLTDDLVSQLGSAFVQVNSFAVSATDATLPPTLNMAYNGATPGNLFTGLDGILDPGQFITLTVEIEFNPIAAGILVPLRNQAMAQGNGPDGNPVQDMSDDGTDPGSDNPDAPGDLDPDPMNPTFDDPTPIEVPRVYTVKELTSVERAASGIVGNYDLVFSIIMQNTGNVDIDSLQVMDDLFTQFEASFVEVLSAVSGPATNATMNPTLNPAFLGVASDGNILAGNDGLIKTLEKVNYIVTVEVDPNVAGSPSPLVDNQAIGSGDGPRGDFVQDLSDDGDDPLTENTGFPGDDPNDPRSVDDPTPVPVPSINVSKNYFDIVEAASDVEGNVDVTFELKIENTGNINLDSISLTDDLAAQLGGAFVQIISPPVVSGLANTLPTANAGYAGNTSDSLLLDGISGLLEPNEQITIMFMAELNPNATNAIVPLMNQAMAAGIDTSGNTVNDLSDSGPEPEDNNIGSPGDTGGQDDPSLLELPSVSVAKSVSAFEFAVSNTVGNFDVTFTFELQNTGNVILDSIQLADNLMDDLGSSFVRVVPAIEAGVVANPLISSSNADVNPAYDPAFMASGIDTSIFDGISGTMSQDQIITIELIVEVNPNSATAPDTLFNQATASGIFNDLIVTDLSDSGATAESNNPGAPNDSGGSADPTPLVLSDINISKEVVSAVDAASNLEGNIDITFEMVIKNKGNDTITLITLNDDLAGQLGAAYVGLTGDSVVITSTTATQGPSLSGLYTGGSEPIFSGTDGILAPNEIITVRISAEIDPDAVDADMNGIPDTLYNQATTSALNSSGVTINDISDSGTDPESNNPGAPGDSGGMDDPTPIAIPVISVAKIVTGYATASSGTLGNLDVMYQIVFKNTGNVPLININLLDTLSANANIGPAHVGIAASGTPTIINSNANVNPNFNGGFTGFAGNSNIFDGMSGFLDPCDSIRIQFTAEMNPALALDPEMLFNQVQITGENDGVIVQDVSDSGNDPKTNNPDGDTNDGNGPDGPDDPTPVYPCISNCIVICTSQINVSLDENCEAEIKPSGVSNIIKPYCDFYYGLELRDENGVAIAGNMLFSEHVGQTLEYTLSEPECENTCWGNILVENKFDPVIQCMSDTISCGELLVLAPPIVVNNCGEITLKLLNRTTQDIACEDPNLQLIITETWVASDLSGTRTDTCTQTLSVEKFDISEVVGPAIKDTLLNCAVGTMPSPNSLGVPTLNGIALYPDNFIECGIFVSFEDDFFSFGNDCTSGVQRTWTVNNWICGTDNSVQFTQLITFIDTTGPVLSNVPSDVTVSTSGFTCEAQVAIPAITAVDACNPDDIRVDIQYEGGFAQNQNGTTVGIGAGTSKVTYVVYDVCGNTSAASYNVTVKDLEQPVTICDAFTTVSLNSEGRASLAASKLDNGSLDECGPVSLAISRMDDNLGFLEAVDFSCADVGGDNIMVALRVTDVSGNANTCMAQVEVQDKVPPVLVSGLPDITISCTFPFSSDNLVVFGTIVNDVDSIKPIVIDDPSVQFSGPARDGLILDNCSTAAMSEVMSGDVNSCGNGTMIRTITATSPSGETTTLIQRITLVNPTPFVEADITWPADITLNQCDGDGLNPLNFPEGQGLPQYVEDHCDMVSSTYDDKVLSNTPNGGGCLMIERTWFVSDWCQKINGQYILFENIQMITINNTVVPEITSACDNIRVESIDGACGGAQVSLVASGTDDCVTPEDLIWSFTIDLYSDGSIDSAGTGNDASDIYPVGVHEITFVVGDGCGNISGCNYTFEVDNVKAPSPKCFQGLSASLTPMDTTGDNLADTELLMLTPDFLDAGSDHACGYDLLFSFSADVNDTMRVFGCDDLGQQGIQLWVTDPNGNQDFCATFIIVEDNNDVDLCPAGSGLVAINGTLFTEEQVEVSEVEVYLDGSDLMKMSDEVGTYNFADMPKGGSYEVMPEKNTGHSNGVTTLDLIYIQKHILGIKVIESPYKLLAADINNDSKITGSDLLELRKLILGIYEEFPNNKSWKFVDAKHTFIDAQDPWAQSIPETSQVYDLSQDMKVDFYGLKVGDINGSVVLGGSPLHAEVRSSDEAFKLSYNDRMLKAGEVVNVPFYGDSINNIIGYQFTMNVDPRLADLGEVKGVGAGVSGLNFGMRYMDKGMITSSWDNSSKAELEYEAPLFSLTLVAHENVKLSELLSLSSEVTTSEAYSESGEILDIELGLRGNENVVGVPELFQNQPNPWTKTTIITFKLPEAARASLRIYDVAGKLVKEHTADYGAGLHKYEMIEEEFSSRGVYYYELLTNDYKLSKKMVLIK